MRRILLFSLASLTAFPLLAWSPKTEIAMTQLALELGPRDLARIVEMHEQAFEEGLSAGRREELRGKLADHLATRDGRLQDRIIEEASAIVEAIRSREPMETIVYRLGVVSHLVGDANNPFMTFESTKLESRRADYESYLERRLVKFRPVFYGIDRRFDPRSLIARSVRRSSGYGPMLEYEYFRGGEIRSSRAFDDRSTAFAVASLSYSHSITDLVNVYYAIWNRVEGDVRGARRLRPGQIPVPEQHLRGGIRGD